MQRQSILAIAILAAAVAASDAFARGGGGCIAEGTPILTPGGPTPIEDLRPGDKVLTIADGQQDVGKVIAIYRVHAEEYIELAISSGNILVTPEHPFMVGQGVFRTAGSLRAGDEVCVLKNGLARPTALLSARSVAATSDALNLLTDKGMFVAAGFIVHNKGCFLPDTPVMLPDGRQLAIRDVRPGQELLAFKPDGTAVAARVQAVMTIQADEYFIVTTGRMAVRVTAEHPFLTGNAVGGEFRTVQALKPGDTVYAWDGRGLAAQPITSIERIRQSVRVYNLQTDWPNTFFAAGVAVHNKGGGCFPAGTCVQTPDGPRPIETLKPGDEVVSIDDAGRMVKSRAVGVFSTESPLLLLRTDRGELRTTAEHPIALAGGGFRLAGELAPGEAVLFWRDGRAQHAAVIEVRHTCEVVTVYNLTVGRPHTFVADGFLVHNKGGGCFPAGTAVQTPGGPRSIETFTPGDVVVSIDDGGRPVVSEVEDVFATHSPLLLLRTDRGELRTTAEHPIRMAGGGFRLAGDLAPGDVVMLWRDGRAQSATVSEARPTGQMATVYNLTVGSPHTFIADGFIVHNKGGGGFHGGSHGGSGGSGGSVLGGLMVIAVIIAIIWGVGFVAKAAGRSRSDENLDFVYSRSAIASKAGKTAKLLEFLARTDPDLAPQALQQAAQRTFIQLQTCWQARDYGPMKPLMMGDLYAQHVAQIEAMMRSHEINSIAGLKVQGVDIVNVRYTNDPSQREFTALITATARDYYTDDRTGRFLRGDKEPAAFQEFWTFQRQGKAWLLREIEQTRESDALKEENFFEQFTDRGLGQIYGQEAGKGGVIGPWLEKGAATKEAKTERLLNFLVQTDKLWDRPKMMERARDVFMHVMLAQQCTMPVPADELFPAVAKSLGDMVAAWKSSATAVEYRNLCIRKVELILVRNFADNARDEFTVRISAHAQKVITRAGAVVSRDEDVAPFVQYWTFGRLDGQWKLKEVLPDATGQAMIGQENLDQDSSAAQLQWYYRQTRAV
ncbi:MAG: Hint domain-containing protein [Phycisphaerae bacterium]